jgi:hypothetical protein
MEDHPRGPAQRTRRRLEEKASVVTALWGGVARKP